MELPNPLSPRANAFSIASIMSGPGMAGMEAMYLAGYPSPVPPQRSTDCSFDWTQATASHYTPAFMKGMEALDVSGQLRHI
ncbi:hypothetical protein BaRGS_00028809 [Batillaria attramentaria]|uniref:Uncharacterized protein n=1 Tax=Batillaria attramentaria TaxID=370345 RepID=A0ABD0JY97_9CAEN